MLVAFITILSCAPHGSIARMFISIQKHAFVATILPYAKYSLDRSHRVFFLIKYTSNYRFEYIPRCVSLNAYTYSHISVLNAKALFK